MKMPAKNSRAMLVLETLRFCGLVTVADGVALHGLMGANLDDTAAMYDELVARGCMEKVGARYCVTEALLRRYDPKPAPTGKPVPPREAPPFRPLSARHRVSVRGLREGSNDLLGLPSTYAKLEGN